MGHKYCHCNMCKIDNCANAFQFATNVESKEWDSWPCRGSFVLTQLYHQPVEPVEVRTVQTKPCPFVYQVRPSCGRCASGFHQCNVKGIWCWAGRDEYKWRLLFLLTSATKPGPRETNSRSLRAHDAKICVSGADDEMPRKILFIHSGLTSESSQTSKKNDTFIKGGKVGESCRLVEHSHPQINPKWLVTVRSF